MIFSLEVNFFRNLFIFFSFIHKMFKSAQIYRINRKREEKKMFVWIFFQFVTLKFVSQYAAIFHHDCNNNKQTGEELSQWHWVIAYHHTDWFHWIVLICWFELIFSAIFYVWKTKIASFLVNFVLEYTNSRKI